MTNHPFTPFQFGASGCLKSNPNPPDDTVAVQRAINASIAAQRPLYLYGYFGIHDKVTIDGDLQVFCAGGLVACSRVPQTCLLEITNGGLEITGNLSMIGNYNGNYECAVWIHSTAQNKPVQYFRINTATFYAFKMGYRIGDVAIPSAIVSDFIISGGSFYGCPINMQVEGAETYVHWIAPIANADQFYAGGRNAWPGIKIRNFIVIGAEVRVTGGQIDLYGNPGDDCCNVELQPLTATLFREGTAHGRFYAVNCLMEADWPLAVTTNPSNLVIDALGFFGLLSFDNCSGYRNTNAPFIVTDPSFAGEIIYSNMRMFSPTSRTAKNIDCSPTTHIHSDGKGFGKRFLDDFAGIDGGIVHHPKQMIVEVTSVAGEQFNTLGTIFPVKFQNKTVGDIFDRYSSAYDQARGIFTAPYALKDVELWATILTTGVVGTIILVVDGVQYEYGSFDHDGQISIRLSSMAGGGALGVQLRPDTHTGNAHVSPFSSRLAISASV